MKRIALIRTKGNIKEIQQIDENNLIKEISNTEGRIEKEIEAEEEIDTNGNVIVELAESAINKVLREIFNIKPDSIIIALDNSNKNPVHEKIFENLLKSTGYKSVYASYMIYRNSNIQK